MNIKVLSVQAYAASYYLSIHLWNTNTRYTGHAVEELSQSIL
jgi:hypothetical protein